jgi:hypothetical protein
MINREQTNLYLSHLDLLAEALYSCWQNSYCECTQQLNKAKLRVQIQTYGYYKHEDAIKKEIPLHFVNRFQFKTLTWANKFSDAINENTLCQYVELYKQVITEIESNLFTLINKEDKIAYANILLNDFDKGYIHNRNLDVEERDCKYRLIFELVLDGKFISDENKDGLIIETSTTYPLYDLTMRLINHLNFIDKLICLFSHFKIDLILLSDKSGFNLYIFDTNKKNTKSNNQFGTSTIGTTYVRVRKRTNSRMIVHPKFYSLLSDDCIIKIMHYLIVKKVLETTNSDLWLFWFNRKYIKVPAPLKWKGSNTLLSNIIQHLCGESNATTIKTVFCTQSYVKPTRKIYESGKMHKEIEQIITISKKLLIPFGQASFISSLNGFGEVSTACCISL